MDEHTPPPQSPAIGSNTDSVGALLARHLTSLRAYVRLRGGPNLRRWESDSDLVQSVCAEVLRGEERFDYQGEDAFRHWLFTTALRKLVEKNRYHRAQRRDRERIEGGARVDHDLAACYASLVTPSQTAMGNEAMARLEQALDTMPESWRDAVLMSRLMGFPYPEIARRLGQAESTVRANLSRAIARVGRVLAGDA